MDSADLQPGKGLKRASTVLDKEDLSHDTKDHRIQPAVPVTNGAATNGNAQKRKASINKSYAADSSDDDAPLVSCAPPFTINALTSSATKQASANFR